MWPKPHSAVLFVSFATLTYAATVISPGGSASPARTLFSRDGHAHSHTHGSPLLELNETEVTRYHLPTPPSYWSIDIDNPHDPNNPRHPGLMAAHILFMCLAFFVALPAGIALRSVKHSLHGLAVLSFYGFYVLGCACSALYAKSTPNMYEGAVHSKQGYVIIIAALCLSAIDASQVLLRAYQHVRSGGSLQPQILWRRVIRGVDERESKMLNTEYHKLISEEAQSIDYESGPSSPPEWNEEQNPHSQWANEVHRHRRAHSHTSQGTLVSPSRAAAAYLEHEEAKAPLWTRVGRIMFAVAERALVFAGFAMLTTGVVTYTGGCRESYVNGCLAHLIKGGIFWCYGLVTFARFLGAFSDFGWSWNRLPHGRPKATAEMVESLTIFAYGVTNTWMERWGAQAGDPYTTKQIQHIGIAVMFWFAGLVGIGIESNWVRRLLAQSARPSSAQASEEPSSDTQYGWSFNPFPALVIGVTGAAMAAHAQTYVFQVQIHMLWGGFLVGFSALRFLTYFLIWLKPPQETSPSRPPTEAMASFFLACGGLTFMMSTEELTIAAMRRGRDDAMMFLNVAVAVTCFSFCWVFFVVVFKAWLKRRSANAAV